MDITQNKLVIKQKVEMLEVFTGFETKNRYGIFDSSGQNFYYAFEESNFFARNFLKQLRPFKLHIIDKNQKDQLLIERPFYLILAKHKVTRPDGSFAGRIKQKFTIIKKTFEVYDSIDQLMFTCSNSLRHYWTFNIMKDGVQVAKIQKKWSGSGKEFFTDADNFLIDFGNVDKKQKELILATAFAIDLRVFERR